MPPQPFISWEDLFPPTTSADLLLELRIVKKRGEPFLLLPSSPKLAAQALELYPAQNKLARLAKSFLHVALRLGLPPPFPKASVALNRASPFPKFLAGLAGASASFPALAILPGNSRVSGRRFILLLFDEHGHPASVVKAGLGETAQKLIRQETVFLQSLPSGIFGLPVLQATFAGDPVEALVLDFVAGDPAHGEDRPIMGKLFTAWLNQESRVRLPDVPAWTALEKNCSGHPLFTRLTNDLVAASLHPTLFHGDFAPWNIKVSPTDGAWKVIDWERGERIGFPAWDWFHFVIQNGILVEKLSAEDLFQKVEGLLRDPIFQSYAAAAVINGFERSLAAAYLLYCNEYIKPTEGRETSLRLLSLMTKRWFDTNA